MKKGFIKKFGVIFVFAALVVAFRVISDMVGNHAVIESYTIVHGFVFNFLILLLLTFICEGILGEQIYSKT